jgi:iron complex transport system substrate-binding protein
MLSQEGPSPHECDFPPEVARLPSLTEPKFLVTGASYDIDARVKVSLRPDALADIWKDIAKVARALGRERQGERLVEQLKTRVASIAEQCGAARTRPRGAMIEWVDPLMAGGNWMPELVQMAGGENLFGAAGQPPPWLDWEQIVVADPDVVLVHPCGFDLARTLQEMPLHRPGWRGLKAVQHDRIFVTDGKQYFNRPGPHIVVSLEMLAEIFHPELFPSCHEGKGWMRYAAEPRVPRTRSQQP